MPAHFDLIITADYPNRTAELRLLDAHGSQLAWQTDFKTIAVSRQQGLFSKDRPTLDERNLLIRIVHDRAAPATRPLALGQDECLCVLFVFAEARGNSFARYSSCSADRVGSDIRLESKERDASPFRGL